MNSIELLEFPSSKLKVSIERLIISTSCISQGEFLIKNEAQGILKGTIKSKNSIIKFIPDSFEGNSIKVCYFIDASDYKIGKIIAFEAIISSNGGEAVIPVTVNITFPVIDTGLDINICELNDFVKFAKKYPKEAQTLFYKNEFVSWLINIKYEYLSIYDYLVKDRNKERSLENFFIFNQLKDEVRLKVNDNKMHLDIKNDSKEIIKGKILVTRTCWGYLECPCTVKNKSSWITLNTNIVTSSNFMESDTFFLEYTIDTSLIDDNIVLDNIIIGQYIDIDVRVRRKKVAYINLSKEKFLFDDEGYIKIDNFTGNDIKVELSSKDSFLKFNLKSFYVNTTKIIPFTVRLNALQKVNINIKKYHLIESKIFIKITSNSKSYYKTLYITLG